ncbi:MAG TPA: hypothetical protein VGV64_03220 [Thermoplasmata archaeon]|nr:hypothetical protein [Thermoplasmata archaeon]
MVLTKKAALEDKAVDASEADKVVLAVLRRRPSRTTSIQKLGLLVHAAVAGKVPAGFAPHFFGGFSDSLDNSLNELCEEGYVFEGPSGEYALTPAGASLIDNFLSDPLSVKTKDASEKIVGRMVHLSDRDILAIAYETFPELTGNSIIKDRVHRSKKVKNVEVLTVPH